MKLLIKNEIDQNERNAQVRLLDLTPSGTVEEFEQRLFQFLNSQARLKYVGNIKLDLGKESFRWEHPLQVAQRRVIQDLGSYNDAYLGIMNVFWSLSDILRSPWIHDLAPEFIGKKAIFVGAGPSLDTTLEDLKSFRNGRHHLIVVVDVVYEKLLDLGIIPDVVVSTERSGLGPACFEKYKGSAKAIDRDVALFVPQMVDPDVVQMWEGRKFFAFRGVADLDFFPMFDDVPRIQTFPSILPTTISMLGTVGIQDVGLIGFDLCYGVEGDELYSHCKMPNPGLSRMQAKIPISNEIQPHIMTIQATTGEMKKTKSIWWGFRSHLNSALQNHQMRVVNMSEGIELTCPYVDSTSYLASERKRQTEKSLIRKSSQWVMKRPKRADLGDVIEFLQAADVKIGEFMEKTHNVKKVEEFFSEPRIGRLLNCLLLKDFFEYESEVFRRDGLNKVALSRFREQLKKACQDMRELIGESISAYSSPEKAFAPNEPSAKTEGGQVNEQRGIRHGSTTV